MSRVIPYKNVVAKCENIYEDRAEVLNFPTADIAEIIEGGPYSTHYLRCVREGVFAEFIIDTEKVFYSEYSK